MDANKSLINIPGMLPLNTVQPQGMTIQQQQGNAALDLIKKMFGGQQAPQQAFDLQTLQRFAQGYPIPQQQQGVTLQPQQVLPDVSGQGCLTASGYIKPKVKAPYVTERRVVTNAAVAAGADLVAAGITALGFGTEANRRFNVYQGVRSAEIDNRFIYAIKPTFRAVLKDAAGFIDERMSDIFTKLLYDAFVLAGYEGADDQYLFLSRVECADLRDQPLLLEPYQVVQWISTQHCLRLDQVGQGRNSYTSHTALPAVTAEGITELNITVGIQSWWADKQADAIAKAERGMWNPYKQDFVLPR